MMNRNDTTRPTAEVLRKLLDELAELQSAYDSAKMAESAARSERTDLLNQINRTQAAIDKELGVVRKSAPRDSDWKRGEP